jgi:hypothetical protein
MTSAFLVAMIAAVSCRIHTILTENGIQFRYPPRYAGGPTARSVTHMFAMCCRENGIERRFTMLNHPWTNGQVELMILTGLRAALRHQGCDREARPL